MKPTPLNYLLIGAGGVCSYFLPPFLKTFKPKSVTLYDGDILEERNLDRQMFDSDQVGKHKADALSELYQEFGSDIADITELFKIRNEYFSPASIVQEQDSEFDVIICMADNHVARKTALEAADEWRIPAIIGGNEYYCSEAFIYDPARMEHNGSDPRLRYPEILTDESGNPMSCQGDEAMESAPQLATANHTCASFILSLLWQWTLVVPRMEEEGMHELIHKKTAIEYSSNFNGITYQTMKELELCQQALQTT
jgi:molybdopterin/thiamine biosynthesis adenylyltransferase